MKRQGCLSIWASSVILCCFPGFWHGRVAGGGVGPAVVAALSLSSTVPPSHDLGHTHASIVTGGNGYVGRAILHQLVCRHEQTSNDNKRNDYDGVVAWSLVRPGRVESEREYWRRQQQQEQENQHDDGGRVRWEVRVLPYDMLDGGASLRSALEQVLNDPSSEVHQQADHSSGTMPSSSVGRGPHRCWITVHHTAAVFGPTANHQITALDNVRGTEDLVRTLATATASVSKAADAEIAEEGDGGSLPSMRCHLVITSSMAAVRASGQIPSNGMYYTHKDWNTESKNDENSGWGESYQWSKAASEKRAWELGQELGVPVTALCPSFVFGPPHGFAGGAAGVVASAASSSSESYSLTLVDEWIRGASPVQSRLFVDVRDVARAHVSAASNPAVSVGQRYIVSTEARVPSQEMAGWLRNACLTSSSGGGGALLDPSKIRYDSEYVGGAIPIGKREVESAERLERDLGVQLRPVKDTMVEMTRALLQRQQQQQQQQQQQNSLEKETTTR